MWGAFSVTQMGVFFVPFPLLLSIPSVEGEVTGNPLKLHLFWSPRPFGGLNEGSVKATSLTFALVTRVKDQINSLMNGYCEASASGSESLTWLG